MVDPAKANEQGDRGPQFGQKVAAAKPQPLVDGSEQPGAQLLAIDPRAVRFEERRSAGRLTLNGVSLEPVEPIRKLGEEILRRRSEMLAALLRKN